MRRLWAPPLALAEFDAADLAADRLGEFGHDPEPFRQFLVRNVPLAEEGDELLEADVGGSDHEGADPLAENLVWRPCSAVHSCMTCVT